MLMMRRASERDRRQIEKLISLRVSQLERDGMGPAGWDSRAVPPLIHDLHDGGVLHLVAAESDEDEILGYLAVSAGLCSPGWTKAEQSEPTLTILSACTHPTASVRPRGVGGQALGSVRSVRVARCMTWWSLDYAAGEPGSRGWVRCAVAPEPLKDHLCEPWQGWEYVGQEPGGRYLLQQQARLIPELKRWITTAVGVPSIADIVPTVPGTPRADRHPARRRT